MKLKVVKQRNVFKPRWWQFRLRYFLWRAERDREYVLSQFDPEVRASYEAAEKEVERRTLYGNE